MPTLNGKSLDILDENIKNLRQLFPEVECDGKIDFDMLRQILGEYVDDDKERYNFKWNGKGKALRFSQTPSTGTLRPCREESKNWDDTQNLYIEGDNLEVLKILQKSYHGKIKMIYIDPPYNTGKDFVYPDNYHDSIENYKTITGQTDEEGNRISTNTEASGRFHTDWLNMMYPRLRLARNLLTDDGVIFISIGDEEVDNLRKICDEVFGEDNFRNQIVIRRGAKSVQAQFDTWDKLGQGLEYILFYTKRSNYRFPKQMKPLDDEKCGGWNNHWRGTDRPTMRYDIFGMIPESGQWRWGKDRSYKAIDNYKRMLKETGQFAESVSQEIIDAWYLNQNDEVDLLRLSATGKPEHYIPPTNETLLNSSWVDLLVGSSSEIGQLFKTKVFDTAKLTSIISRMLNFVSDDSIILDFFSGSATTAHAVMQLNAEDGGNRRFICVQLPEPTQEDSEAFKAGYKNICEIGKERIRRAGEKIKEEVESGNEQLKIDEEPKKIPDIGFKVFKLDSSNLKKWNPDFENLEVTLDDMISNYVPDRTEEDIVYEFMLKMGLDLSYPIDVTEIDGRKIYSIGFGALMMCLDDNITVSVAEDMVRMYREQAPETWKVVFKDNGFADDCTKTNVKLTLIQAGLEEDAFTTV